MRLSTTPTLAPSLLQPITLLWYALKKARDTLRDPKQGDERLQLSLEAIDACRARLDACRARLDRANREASHDNTTRVSSSRSGSDSYLEDGTTSSPSSQRDLVAIIVGYQEECRTLLSAMSLPRLLRRPLIALSNALEKAQTTLCDTTLDSKRSCDVINACCAYLVNVKGGQEVTDGTLYELSQVVQDQQIAHMARQERVAVTALASVNTNDEFNSDNSWEMLRQRLGQQRIKHFPTTTALYEYLLLRVTPVIHTSAEAMLAIAKGGMIHCRWKAGVEPSSAANPDRDDRRGYETSTFGEAFKRRAFGNGNGWPKSEIANAMPKYGALSPLDDQTNAGRPLIQCRAYGRFRCHMAMHTFGNTTFTLGDTSEQRARDTVCDFENIAHIFLRLSDSDLAMFFQRSGPLEFSSVPYIECQIHGCVFAGRDVELVDVPPEKEWTEAERLAIEAWRRKLPHVELRERSEQ